MAKKIKEFDFEKKAQELLEKAHEKGLDDDLIFNTTFEQFIRLKKMTDNSWEEYLETGSLIEGTGSMGQKVVKSNPLIKDFNLTHTNLLKTFDWLERYIDRIDASEEDNWL